MFWDISKSLSHNCLFNFIVGPRGAGKTYGFKQWAISSFLKTGAQFIYVRRFKEEMRDVAKFFDDIQEAFPEHEFEYKRGAFKIDGETAGWPVSLSTAKIKKSVAFPHVNKICFDEFILDSGVYHYLPDEVTAFLELYETIARMRDVTCFLLSNAITITNPYFLYFDISLPYGKKIFKRGEILLEMTENEEFIEAKKATRFGKVIEGTSYGNYAMENKFLRDNRNFIQKKSARAKPYFNFMFMDAMYGVWVDYDAGLMFVSENADKCCRLIVALTNEDHQPNTMFLKSKRQLYQFQTFIDQYMLGNVRFESVNIKNICNQIMKWSV